MAARSGTSESVILRIEIPQGLKAMECILSSQASLAAGTIGVARIKWKSFLSQMPSLPPFLANFSQYAPKNEKKASAHTAR
eukprot:4360904-Heterocapsa_arctica.AAC.1